MDNYNKNNRFISINPAAVWMFVALSDRPQRPKEDGRIVCNRLGEQVPERRQRARLLQSFGKGTKVDERGFVNGEMWILFLLYSFMCVYLAYAQAL
jgi:hypothetical protein